MNRLENPVAVLGMAGALWAAAAVAGASLDVFARISPGAAVALAVVACGLPPAVLALDESVRRYVSGVAARKVLVPFAALTVVIVAMLLALLVRDLTGAAAVSGPFAVLTYFLVPFWIGLATEIARRAASLRRSAPATSPASRRDAPRAARTSARGAGAAGA